MSSPHPIFPSFSFDDAAEKIPARQYSYGEHSDQKLEIYGDASKSEKTVVLIHGGYWRALFDCEHIRPLGVALAQAGFHIAIPEFRRIAGEPDLTISDLSTALQSLTEQYSETRSLILIGYSSGGHLALLVADDFPTVEHVIGLAPVTDLQESQVRELGRGAVHEWLGVDAIERSDLDPMQRPPLSKPLTFIQGGADERVPIEITLNYLKQMALSGGEIEMVELEGTTHFEMMEVPSPTYSAILNALN